MSGGIVTVITLRGAPGATTTALLVAGAVGQRALVVEADLAGGVLAVRYGLGREPGLTTLAAARPTDSGAWATHAQSAGGIPVLVGPDSPTAAESLWRSAGGRLRALLRVADAELVVVDGGRFDHRAVPMVADSQLVLVVLHPIAEHLVALSHQLSVLHRAAEGGRVAAVLSGDGPYGESDVARDLGVEVLGRLPADPRAARALVGGGLSAAAFRRSQLARAGATLAETVTRTLRVQEPLSSVEVAR